MKKWLVFLFIMMSVTAFAGSNRSIVIISIDALHPDAIHMAAPTHIQRMIKKGVYTLNGKSVHPPKTLVSHTAMLIGKTPQVSGLVSNVWKSGDPKILEETLFHDAKQNGFKTYYVYSKQKLAFLENSAIDKSTYAGEDSVYVGEKIVKEEINDYFLFLHISGLDYVGPKYGWLSKAYIEELNYIDDDLGDIITRLIHLENTTVIITSDHSGHKKIHGTDHPEDYKVPFIIYSDMADFSDLQNQPYSTHQLRQVLKRVISK